MTNEERNQVAIDALQFFKQKLNNGIYGEFVGNFDTAISAIEKQIPKKVNISLKGTTGWNTKCRCPNCHSMVSHGKYCSNCGQALDFNVNGSDTDDK